MIPHQGLQNMKFIKPPTTLETLCVLQFIFDVPTISLLVRCFLQLLEAAQVPRQRLRKPHQLRKPAPRVCPKVRDACVAKILLPRTI